MGFYLLSFVYFDTQVVSHLDIGSPVKQLPMSFLIRAFIFYMSSYFLIQNSPGSSCTLPDPALEWADLSLRSPGVFYWRTLKKQDLGTYPSHAGFIASDPLQHREVGSTYTCAHISMAVSMSVQPWLPFQPSTIGLILAFSFHISISLLQQQEARLLFFSICLPTYFPMCQANPLGPDNKEENKFVFKIISVF
jgi:hypothetical protein